MIKITMKRIALFLILTFIYTNIIVQVNTQAQFNPFQQPQSPTCINGKKNYNNPLIPNYSFCYDSSIEVSDNIRKANNEEIDNYYQITKSKSLNLIGQIQLKKGNDTVIMDIKEGKTAYSPQNYCTTENLNESNDPYGVFQTPRGSFVHVSPTLNYDYQTEYSEKYNGLKDNESNILNAKVPYKTEPTKVPTPYDINLNAYIDNINFDSKKINAENTVDAKESKYPFTLTIQGHQLQYQSNKDKEIIRNKGYNPNSYNITKQTLITKSDTTPDQMSEDFLKGKGRCFDNTHRLYGIRLNTDLIINNQHSSGYNISPEANKDYKEVIQKDNNKSKTEYQFSSQQIPSIKIYSSTNILSSFADTLESICWNELSCERRDKILKRPPSITDMTPKTALTKDVERLTIIKTKQKEDNQKMFDDLLLEAKNPFAKSPVKLNYKVNCQGISEFLGSEVPAPLIIKIQKDPNLRAEEMLYNVLGKSIAKGHRIIASIKSDECYWGGVIVKKTYNQEIEISKGVDNVGIYSYKDTKNKFEWKVSDITQNNSKVIWQENDNDYQLNLKEKSTLSSEQFNLDGDRIWTDDELFSRVRIYGSFELNNIDGSKDKSIKFEYGDNKNYNVGKYLNESPESNKVYIKDNNLESNVYRGSIEENLIVNGRDSSLEGKLINENNFNLEKDFDKNNRKVRLRFIDDGDRIRYSNSYDKENKPAVWIISHGWCDTNQSFEPIAREIKKVHPNDIVMTFDWSQASFNSCGSCSGNNCPTGVVRAATWIEPTAKVLKDRLIKWGLNDGDNLRVVGHSLGSILSMELSSKYTNKAAQLIALDPPNENTKILESDLWGSKETIFGAGSAKLPKGDEKQNSTYESWGNTKYYVNNYDLRKDFNESTQHSRAFYGKFSFAGNREMASNAHESYEIDYHYNNYFSDIGAEHGHVVTTFKRLVTEIYFARNLNKEDRALHLQDIWNNRQNQWLKKLGRKNTDNGQIDGNKPDDIKTMEVAVSIYDKKEVLRYKQY
jgi:hypothetical protein